MTIRCSFWPLPVRAETVLPGHVQRGQGAAGGGGDTVAEVVPRREQLLHHEVDVQAGAAAEAVALDHQGHLGGEGGSGGGKGRARTRDADVNSML